MILSRSFLQSTLVVVTCLVPLLTEAASLQQIQTVSVGGVAASQLPPEHIQRSILRLLEQEMAGKVRAIHAVVVDPLDPIKIPSGDIGLRVSPNGVVEGLGRRAFHVAAGARNRRHRRPHRRGHLGVGIAPAPYASGGMNAL